MSACFWIAEILTTGLLGLLRGVWAGETVASRVCRVDKSLPLEACFLLVRVGAIAHGRRGVNYLLSLCCHKFVVVDD